jgi:hypothetical protein
MIGDFFGGGLSALSGAQSVLFSGYAPGINISPFGGPGSVNSQMAFEFGSDIIFDDVFTTGVGTDVAGGSGADTFSLLEPVPPSNAQTAPGPNFTFNGGTAVYTNNTTSTTAQPGVYSDGQTWYLVYSYSSTIGGTSLVPVPAPGMSARRVKISENFSPEVRDRVFANYNFFNDAYGGLGDVSRYLLGVEKVLVDGLISVEARLPMAGTYASTQDFERVGDRDFELGNPVVLAKAVLLRADNWLWTAGAGVGIPLAEDTRIRAGNRDIVVIENKTVRMLPFTALIIRPTRDSTLQGYVQVDQAVNGDPVYANLFGGSLPKLGTFTDSTLMHVDLAYTHSLYRNCSAPLINQIIGAAELHYTGTVQESDLVSGNGLNYTNLKNNFNILNATAGMHFQLGNNLIVSPAMSVPLRDGLDEQYDYEAIVQINYLR